MSYLHHNHQDTIHRNQQQQQQQQQPPSSNTHHHLHHHNGLYDPYDNDYDQGTNASSSNNWNQHPDSQPHTHHNTLLLDVVQSYEWASVISRLSSHPHEASSRGPHGRTALHIACENDAPAVVIQALLAAYPEASTIVGTSDMNPLHITCSSQHASVEVVRVLLEGTDTDSDNNMSDVNKAAAMQTTMRDVDGDTPLQAACRCGAPIEVLAVLLRADPSAVTKRDYEGLTPLLRLWVRYFVTLGDDVIESVRGPEDLVGQLGEAWEKTMLLLKCAHHKTLTNADLVLHHHRATDDEDFEDFSAVHAAAAVDCPRAVLKIAVTLYPHQLERRDDLGRVPLQIAAQAPIYKVHDLSVDGYSYELFDGVAAWDERDDDHDPSNHTNTTTDCNDNDNGTTNSTAGPSVIEILLKANENAAGVTDRDQRLPINLAIESGKNWRDGVELILRAYPEALSFIDPASRLYPFMLAAITSTNTVTSVYELLRANPELVRGGIVDRNEKFLEKPAILEPSLSSLPVSASSSSAALNVVIVSDGDGGGGGGGHRRKDGTNDISPSTIPTAPPSIKQELSECTCNNHTITQQQLHKSFTNEKGGVKHSSSTCSLERCNISTDPEDVAKRKKIQNTAGSPNITTAHNKDGTNKNQGNICGKIRYHGRVL